MDKETIKEELLKEVADWFCEAYCRFYDIKEYCKDCPIKDKNCWLNSKDGVMKFDFDKHIWEGWTVRDFINELDMFVDRFVSNSREFHTNITRNDIKKFCMDNQPYYKKYIPDVVNYFCDKYNIK